MTVNPDEVNPDEVNSDEVNSDKVNPDISDKDKGNVALSLITALDSTVGAVINKGLCSIEVASRIVKEYCDPTEYRKIFAEINKNNLRISEKSWKLFSSSYGEVRIRASYPNFYIKSLLVGAIENENKGNCDEFYESLLDFLRIIMPPEMEKSDGVRSMIISNFLKGFFTKNDYLELKKIGIDAFTLVALSKPFDEEDLDFLKNIANLGFVGHSQYLCFRAYLHKGTTVEQCLEIKKRASGNEEFEKEMEKAGLLNPGK